MKIVVTKEHIERAIAEHIDDEGISRSCPFALALKDAGLISGDFRVGERVIQCKPGIRFTFSPSLSHYNLYLSTTWQAALENAPFEFEISPSLTGNRKG